MTEKQEKTFNLHEALNHSKPQKQKDKPAQKGDPHLEEDLEQEINTIEEMEKELDSKPAGELSHEELTDEVTGLNILLKESEQKMLRAVAELENARRRRDIDVQNAHKYGIEKFVKELLPVIDSLEIAITAITDEKTKEGIELTRKMFLGTLAKFNIEQIDPANKPFDPNHHEAMSQIESKDHTTNTVVTVMQKGYTLNGRLIRPALVIVAK